MAFIKDGLDISFEMSLKEVLEWEATHQAILSQGDELKEAGSMAIYEGTREK